MHKNSKAKLENLSSRPSTGVLPLIPLGDFRHHCKNSFKSKEKIISTQRGPDLRN